MRFFATLQLLARTTTVTRMLLAPPAVNHEHRTRRVSSAGSLLSLLVACSAPLGEEVPSFEGTLPILPADDRRVEAPTPSPTAMADDFLEAPSGESPGPVQSPAGDVIPAPATPNADSEPNAGAPGELPVAPPEPPQRVAVGLAARPANSTCFARPEAEVPFLLSESGCVDGAEPLEPAAGLIPYSVNAPLWSDGADKQRWFALPEGTQVQVEDDGHFLFPTGTVLVKDFSIEGQKIETRLMMLGEDGQWSGYSYAWREDESDAELLPSALRRRVGTQEWTYPSRENCGQCHTEAAGESLGPSADQLDGDHVYELGIANQLDTLSSIGVLAPLSGAAADHFTLSRFEDEGASLGERARGYLDSNCSHCHRPGGVEETAFDLRYETPLSETRICDTPPSRGNFGLFGARLLLPGDPEFSLISVRMHSSISTVRMPLVGTAVVDPRGTALIDAWIEQLAGCNDE